MPPDARDDLRATETAILHDTERLAAIEREKQSRDPLDPEVPELSERAEDVAESVRAKAAAERSLAEEIQADH